MKVLLLFVTFLFISLIGSAQTAVIDQSRPENTLNAVFDAAKTGNLESTRALCPPDGITGDGDVRSLCRMADDDQEVKDEFISLFRNARIEGSITYKTWEGNEYCTIDFVFGTEDEMRKETMGLIRINDKWYLASF